MVPRQANIWPVAPTTEQQRWLKWCCWFWRQGTDFHFYIRFGVSTNLSLFISCSTKSLFIRFNGVQLVPTPSIQTSLYDWRRELNLKALNEHTICIEFTTQTSCCNTQCLLRQEHQNLEYGKRDLHSHTAENTLRRSTLSLSVTMANMLQVDHMMKLFICGMSRCVCIGIFVYMAKCSYLSMGLQGRNTFKVMAQWRCGFRH